MAIQTLAATIMKTFRIKSSSWINYFLTWVIILLTISVIGLKLLPNNTVGLLILTAIALTLNHYITRFTATALTEWTVTKKEITIKWMEQIIFHKKADRTINWDEIKAYKLGSEKIFDRFKLILHDGTIVRIWHDNLITKDDFDSFISHFINRVELHNKAEEVKSLPQNGI